MKKLMMLLVILTLALGSKADTYIWEPFDPDNSGEIIGDETFDDLKWQISIYMDECTTQVRIGWEVVSKFVEETIDYVLSHIIRDDYTTEEQFEGNKQFFEEKIREFKDNYDSGVMHMTAYFGIREYFIDPEAEFLN